ncbi:MAG: sugar phosphate isomerase/epimerase [Candidatus Edwardsbacteria bacterium]|nr:sugar phosphate isomerase/epimerase [Candidatus Edwardsbacteria bacterium]
MRKGIFSYFGYELNFKESINLIHKYGFNYTSLWYGNENIEYQNGEIEKASKIAEGNGVVIENVHTAFENANFLWQDALGRSLIKREYEKCIRFCGRQGISYMVIHPSKSSRPPKYNNEGLEILVSLLKTAKNEGVTIAIENTRKVEYIDFIFENIDHRNLCICYDSSHDHLYGMPPIAIIKKWGALIKLTHLSDNNGKEDNHWLPGKGIVDWIKVIDALRKIKYKGVLNLEVFPQRKDEDVETFLFDAQQCLDKISEK